jgi:DNA segregation ATPase FtsK/SpoIIIE, S-DNA-T family
MGRKKIKKDTREDEEKAGILKVETLSWIFAIGFFVLSVFFMLASFGKAGFVGLKTYQVFSMMFGLGYYLIPILGIILAISFAKSIKQSMSVAKFIGASLFFISSLSLLDLIFKGKGGFVGNLLHQPLVKLFDVYAATVILLALIVVSMLVIFDAPLNISSLINIFRKNKIEGEEEAEVKIVSGGEPLKDPREIDKKPAGIPAPLSIKTPPKEEGSEFNIFKSSSILSKPFTPPPLSLLERDKGKPEVGDIKANANIIKRTLQNFGIIVDMDEISIGPSVTRYALKPAEGVKLSRILALQNNLELALAAHPVRIEAPIPGKSLVGIEIPNMTKTMVGLGSLLAQSEYTDSEKSLMLGLGKSITGTGIFANLAKMPHLLIAGATGSGKSVTIHAIINSLLFRNSPETLKFIMIDPKRVELTLYNKISHLLTPVITDAKKAIMSLKWAAKEMDRRYDILEKAHVRDIESYHKNILSPALENYKKDKNGKEASGLPDAMPYIVVVIDELADIMQAYPRELEAAIVRLAQMSRAVGIHLILSTQRPSVNVITGLIKANVPTRIALQVASQFDSRTILDSAGAEKLLGAGDMLYLSGEMSKPIRLQCPYISETEVKKVVEYLIKNYEEEAPSDISMEAEQSKNVMFEVLADDGGAEEDDLYEEARETVIRAGKASTSYLQRKLRIGYARAARLVDILEEKGVISGGDGAKPREVLIKPEGGFVTEQQENDNESA